MPFSEKDLDRILDWFAAVARNGEDVVKDYELAERISSMRTALERSRRAA